MIAGSLASFSTCRRCCTLIETAWPGIAPDRTRSVYLVNCWAYRGDGAPARPLGLAAPAALGRLHAARVVAVAGQEVEWTGHEWRVDGHGVPTG